VELVGDLLAQETKDIAQLEASITTNDHKQFREGNSSSYYLFFSRNRLICHFISTAAHAIKGAAMNLHLPSLVHAAKAAEMLGKHLERGVNPHWNVGYASWRQPYVELIRKEFARIKDFLPTAQQWADEGVD
jgi:HPt (histidine-containing phosphotransfer) domain-containing protein